MEVRYPVHPDDFVGLSTQDLRARFVIEDLFAPGAVRLAMSQQDRLVVGGVIPLDGAIRLTSPSELRSDAFCQRRELVVVCLDGPGTVTVDDTDYPLNTEDALYVGVGARDIYFHGAGSVFYLVSATAQRTFPTTLIHRDDAELVEVGTAESSNLRWIRKYVHAGGVQSATLAVGITTLAPGSVWNTMPCHIHERRTEVYLYFGLGTTGRVVHLCGKPEETRHLFLGDRQAVISPTWSIHTGAGTCSYKFVWSTAGENLAYDDMDPVETASLR